MRSLAFVALLAFVGCSANQRQDTLKATLAAIDAGDAAWDLYNAKHQADIAKTAPDRATAESQLAAWRTGEDAKVMKLIKAALDATAAAALVLDDPSIATAVDAGTKLANELKAAKVIP